MAEAFQYTLLQVVPRLERGERINAGVVVHCRRHRFLAARVHLDPDRLAALDSDADPAEVASMLQTAMEDATYSTEGLSGPFEDGSFVLDSVGDADCRIETRIAPLGDVVLVSVLYGAACPAA